MVNRLSGVFLFACLLLLTSCFEIRETLEIRKEGDGAYTMIMDFSRSKSLFQMIMQLADNEQEMQREFGGNPLQGLDSGFQELSAYLNAMDGIHEAHGIKDEDSFRFGIAFNFDNINALNLALSEIDASDQKTNYRPYYDYSKGKLDKTNYFNMQNLTKEIKPEEDFAADNEVFKTKMEELYETVSYTITIKTDGRIRRFTNEDAVLSQDKTELVYSKTLKELTSKNIDISNEIRFR